ncbi:hypothetical protein F511_07185 [Dorcoceras hygrometricum]|uniref:Uncharacterized protein n=1 Tax=Dorcoceras hygrometricum TaxID=472368 RepID=A0A2Z7AQH4_9LAMI|nr:hypothetical protein F511_07185 [Dorcoceras hygrometricum]
MQNIAQPTVAQHEMWELPTPLIVANRSQQEDEVYGSYPLVLNRHPGYYGFSGGRGVDPAGNAPGGG